MRTIRTGDVFEKRPMAATIGFFDGVHVGHRALIGEVLRSARASGLEAGVVTFSDHPRRVVDGEFRPLLIDTFDERIAKLASLGLDRAVVIDFTPEAARLSAYDFLRQLKERYGVVRLFVGYDHRFGHNRSEGFDDYARYGRELGLEVVLAQPLLWAGSHVSSSVIRKRIASGEAALAAELLGEPFRLTGRVVPGRRLGRQLGFPTANLAFPEREKMIPRSGCYAVEATVDGSRYGGMVNIGRRPTVEDAGHLSVEVHLFDFSGDLYGREVTLAFVAFLREERRMDSLGALAEQLRKDEEQARGLLLGVRKG